MQKNFQAQNFGELKLVHGKAMWWKPMPSLENFGDFLGIYLLKNLFDAISMPANIYFLIGSVIENKIIRRFLRDDSAAGNHQMAFWGCGCTSESGITSVLHNQLSFHGVRGPLSRAALRLDVNTPIGDPALLLPIVFSPKISQKTTGKTIFIPHIFDSLRYTENELIEKSKVDVIVHPIIQGTTVGVENFINEVCSARFVLAGSLHGAIVACAYGVPFCYFDSGYVDKVFKWRDFSASLNIGTYFPTKIEDAYQIYDGMIRKNLMRPQLSPIIESAPFRPKQEVLRKAKDHNWA